jgi:hypothetical protein
LLNSAFWAIFSTNSALFMPLLLVEVGPLDAN